MDVNSGRTGVSEQDLFHELLGGVRYEDWERGRCTLSYNAFSQPLY